MKFLLQSPRRFLLAAILVSMAQCGILASMIVTRASVLRSGQEVLLRSAPVDPRDPLRGDYVVLTYDISSIPVERLKGRRPADNVYAPVYVRLKPAEDGYWAIDEASFDPVAHQEGSAVLVSDPISVSSWLWSPGNQIRLTYGIERYYVPEGEGRSIEDARNDGRVSVAIRVGETGRAQIRALMLDGKPLYEEPLY